MIAKSVLLTLLLASTVLANGVITGPFKTKFSNCPKSSKGIGASIANAFKKLTGSSEQPDLCFEVTLKQLSVKIGAKGTDDDVFVQVCSDVNGEQCCKTPAFKSLLFDDWSRNSQEDWGERYFGTCKNFAFTVKKGLSVSLIKSNDDGLQVEHINVKVKAKATDKKNKVLDEIVFKCGTYLFGSGRRNEQNNLCFPHPYTFARITSMNVTTGSGKQKPDNDGTNDDVEYKICSDVDTDTCCQANPDSTTTNEYQVGKTDKKTSKHFGDCAKILLKINQGPIVTATKKGKDSLNVTKLKFGLYSQALNKTTNYDCGGFKFVDDCKLNPSACTKTTQCKK